MKTDFDRLILIDDNQIVAETLEDYANNFNFQIVYYKFLEEALTEIEKNYVNYVGLILDAKGQRHEGSRKDDDSHITYAITELTKLEERGKKLPWVIFTGYFEKYSTDYSYLVDRIFSKGRDEQKIIQYFSRIRDHSIPYRIRNKYPDTFTILEKGILPNDDYHKLFEILLQLEENKFDVSYFTDLRKILESIIRKIAESVKFPSFLIKRDEIVLDWAIKYLSGLPINDTNGNNMYKYPPDYIPLFSRHISTIFSSTKNLTSIVTHKYKEPLSINAIRCAVFGLLELVDWLDKYLDSNN